MSVFIFLSSLVCALGQDTLFFRDGTYSVARVTEITFRKIKFMQYSESGDSARRTEKASKLDSVIFKNGYVFRKGLSEDGSELPAPWKRFASYWDGRRFGEVKTSFARSFVAANYFAGVIVIGLPYTLYKSSRNPRLRELPTREAYRFRDDKDFAKGYKNGVKRTHLNATMPLYCAGLVSSLLGLAIFLPKDHNFE